MAQSERPARASVDRNLLREAMREPLLSRDRESELARAWTELRDEAALHELVSRHRRMVVSVAARFRRSGLPLADLIQEGNVGLLQAAARFDPERNVRFSTYAIWWVRAAVQDYVVRNWSMVRLGAGSVQRALFFRLRRLASESDPDLADAARRSIAEQLNMELATVEVVEHQLAAPDRSTNAPLSENGDVEWQDLVVDDAPSPEEQVARRHDADARARWLRAALADLPERERRIIEARHLREEGLTLAELGTSLGVSKERIRQLERRALARLQRMADDDSAVAGSGSC